MSHPIAKALEDAAKKIGVKLSKEAAHAVSDMYRQAGKGTEKVIKNITDADDAHKREITALAEKIAKNHGETGPGSRKRLVQQAEARTELSNAVGVRGDYDAELVVNRTKYPESAAHIEEAQSGQIWRGDTYRQGRPKPSVLTIDKPNADDNRANSLRGIDTRPPDDRDEYPPAMFKEGGTGASVKYIPQPDNGGSGSSMGSALRGLPDGTRIKITTR
ncbi:NucA/NucB deoxyribonuclease domain-containing protein [Streptomyces sp. NPDC001668]|uniref:NucA/NucB deoxyribonuclease domain-containing protein n=1 Tax=unclassified Streptomyces TaxID=2593676 RepID=UPI0033E5046F